jgi:sugar phosphate isomerase/epimerase
MPRPVLLCSSPWADLALEDLAARAAEWGYQGLELCCWGDHLEVQRALAEDDYCQRKLEMLARHELTVAVLDCRRVGQALCGPVDARLQRILPDYVWGDGSTDGVRQRAAEELTATGHVAQKLGVSVLSTNTGSALWPFVAGFPPVGPEDVVATFHDFAARCVPILDVCRDAGLRLACAVAPGQVAFDLASAEMALEAVHGREELGFAFDPSSLHWQGIDPVEFVRRFADRIFHVHVADVALTLTGRSSLLGAYLPAGDPRRGWEPRSPGHGGLDWEGILRALNAAGYDGPLAVDWRDAGMSRDHGADDACKFVKRLDFEPARLPEEQAFRDAT